jgi:hypothetical protein
VPHYDPDEHVQSRPEFVAEWRAETARKRTAGLEPEVGDYDYRNSKAYMEEDLVSAGLREVPGLGTALQYVGERGVLGVVTDHLDDVFPPRGGYYRRGDFNYVGKRPDDFGSDTPHSEGYQHWLDMQAKHGPGGTHPGGVSNDELVGRDSGPRYRRPIGLAGQNRPAARYRLGDEWKPAGLAPDKIVDVQAQLIRAGLLGAGVSRPGVWDTGRRTRTPRCWAGRISRAVGTQTRCWSTSSSIPCPVRSTPRGCTRSSTK